MPLILLVVVFYFLLIRPQRKRQQEQAQMQSNLTPGTSVMTTTGLFATVAALQDDDVILEIAPGVQTRWTKAAIGRVLTPVEDETVDNEEVERETLADETVVDAPERRGDEGSTNPKS
ncbi:preprotein translocase subunit YajC [Sphaerisporangium corydalis]|uniref:Preprotein translocase subunit YajC n=1 Tax=Sphaerisporangium corydalis TaxID=1441875 RepID=A0ABV9E776_9ACTN|nr:preprotein translocase subunit YajC [Sphaerisporangium corydalis]